MTWFDFSGGGGGGIPSAKPDALPAVTPQPWATGGVFGWQNAEDDTTAARRRAMTRLLMNGGSGANMDPSNPAFRTSEGAIGMALANALPAIAGLAGGMFGGASDGGMKGWKV